MKRRSEQSPDNEVLKNLIGLGDNSCQKSYYPQLRKKIQELEEEKNRYLALFDSIVDAIFIIDLTGIIKTVNQEACDLYGYSHEEFSGMHINRLDGENDKNLTRERIKALIEQGSIFFETTHVCADYREITSEVNARLIQYQGEQVIMSVCRNVTDRKRAEQEYASLQEQLQQSQKLEAIGQLAGGVAHDFNNILTAILGYAEMSLDEMHELLGDEHSLIEAMEQIEKSAQRASSLTRQLLAFSRRQITKPRRINLNDTLNDLDKMLRRLITENVTLKIHMTDDLWEVLADSGQIEQVIINLVVNASDAMPNGGVLTLQTQNTIIDEGYVCSHTEAQAGDYILLEVSDTGCGINEETQKKIFEPFFTTKPEGRGTGLGLSMVHGIIKQAGGHIMVYSEIDHGTTIKVFLPVAKGADPIHTTELLPDEMELTGSETILLCEDDDAVRGLIKNALTGAGYTVLEFPNGVKALEEIEQNEHAFQLLITDVIMPDMNGKVLSENLNKVSRHAFPTLFISGYTADVIAHHGVLEEGVEFLEKPFSRNQLLCHVRQVLEKNKDCNTSSASR